MFVWILNILDLVVAITLVGLHFGALLPMLLPVFVYLVVKGIVFIKAPFSILDLIIAAYMILLALGLKTFFTWIFVAYMLYKFVISFV